MRQEARGCLTFQWTRGQTLAALPRLPPCCLHHPCLLLCACPTSCLQPATQELVLCWRQRLSSAVDLIRLVPLDPLEAAAALLIGSASFTHPCPLHIVLQCPTRAATAAGVGGAGTAGCHTASLLQPLTTEGGLQTALPEPAGAQLLLHCSCLWTKEGRSQQQSANCMLPSSLPLPTHLSHRTLAHRSRASLLILRIAAVDLRIDHSAHSTPKATAQIAS